MITKEQFEQLPRARRFSHSRIQCFKDCNRKHYYQYVEEIRTPDNIFTLTGGLFHELLEAYYTGQDTSPVIKEWYAGVDSGKIDKPKDLLENVFKEYLNYYEESDKIEDVTVEDEHIEEWDNGDYFIGKVDRLVKKEGIYIVRDTKTTLGKLKYDYGKVAYNTQLLLYAAMVEERHGIRVEAIEIDEVRLAELQDTPCNKNGKPTADLRRLGLTTYENYFNTLESMGLEDAPEYQHVLKELEKRGHPLFNRVIVQILDDSVKDNNLQDIHDTYRLIQTEFDEDGNKSKARNRNVLCNYCGLSQLCELDYLNPDDRSREILVEQIKKEVVKNEFKK